MGLSAAVLGASGYTGAELLRLLDRHPGIETAVVAGDRSTGRPTAEVHPHLAGVDVPAFVSLDEALDVHTDVIFSCLPSGILRPHLGRLRGAVVVDLSDDLRAEDAWTYGLTEFARREIGPRVANPGCYPTATLLAVLPFARSGSIEGPVIVDAMSGVSGAGRRAEDHLLFATAEGNAGAYGTTSHRHVPEMENQLRALGGFETTVSFTPHLIPLARGLVATVRVRLNEGMDDDRAQAILREAYDDEPFVSVIEGWPQAKAVAGSNRAIVSARVDRRASLLICAAAIDNLGKGAAGQALQNANVALGLEEGLGLETVGVWP